MNDATQPIPIIALNREHDTQPVRIPVRRHTAVLLDVNDRVYSTYGLGTRDTYSAGIRALAELPMQLRASAKVVWTVQSSVRWVGRLEGGGRYLGTLLVADDDTLRKHPLSMLIVPAARI